MLTDQELQSLRNLGNEAEAAADEIKRLRAALAQADAERTALFKTARDNQADAERYRLIAESSQGTIRLDGGPGGARWAAPQYIHWTGHGLDAAMDSAFPD